MKLIIDIPQDVIAYVKETYKGNDVLYCAIKYGIPLDDVKTEINNLPRCWKSEDYEDAIQDAIEIIDKHIGERSNDGINMV